MNQNLHAASFSLIGVLSLFIIWGTALCEAKPDNDDLLSPGPTAANVINFDGKGFIVNGKRTFIASGSVHYARVPRENWRDILLKLKRSGFNTVETYVFWNYHETKEGEFDFTTDSRDLGAFLDTAKEVGLYAIIRVGPYVCSEWTNGGYPNWLIFKPGIKVRENNKPYFDAVDAWWSKMLPIVAAWQIHKGGNVIMVQLENEMPTGGWRYWGTSSDGDHMNHLLDLAHQNGLEVPMFFSGLNHGHDPMPDTPIDHSMRKSPWFSTELWTLWFDQYGNDGEAWYIAPPSSRYKTRDGKQVPYTMMAGERHIWRVLSEGGNGFNLYMFHGGTTFGYFNFNNNKQYGDNREKGMACYDFGALVGQTGNTNTFYQHLKRLGYFAETFSAILADSEDATGQYKDFAQGVSVTARTAPEGTLVFFDNPGGDTTATLKSGVTIKMAAGEIAGFPVQVPITPDVTIAEADTRILGITSQGSRQTIVCFGEKGDIGKIAFSSANAPGAVTAKDADFKFDPQAKSLAFTFPATGAGEEDLRFGATEVRILAMSKEVADKTWMIDTASGRQVVVGAPYLGEFTVDASGSLQSAVDYPWQEPVPTELTIYGKDSARKIELAALPSNASPDLLKLDAWEMSVDSAPALENFNDSNWFTLPDGLPPEMQQDGSDAPYAWYRVHMSGSQEISSLTFSKIADRATFFIDGKAAANFDFSKQKGYNVSIKIPAGDHILSAFVSFTGRRKFDGYVGPLDAADSQKGLRGPVVAGDGNVPITGWKMFGGVDANDSHLNWVIPASTEGAPAYFRTHFHIDGTPESGAAYYFHTEGLSTGSVWLNGHNLGRYPEIVVGCPGLWLPSCWMKTGENTLVIFDEQGNAPGQTSVKLEAEVSRHRISMESKPSAP